MKIINTNLSFTSLSIRKSTTRIILHHAAATSCDAKTIHKWHKQRGWAGIGYHFLVRINGTIERGRPENTIGAHASNHNSNSIGVCFEGNFETEHMTNTQLQSGQELVAYLKNRYGISKVQRHKDVGSTSCPGKYFPFEEITKVSSGNTSLPSSSDSYGKLIEDGCWGKNTTRRLQQIFGTSADGIVSNQYLCYKTKNPGLDSGWDWQNHPSGYSPLIKAIQNHVGVTPDGYIGPNTVRAMQKWLGSIADGHFSSPSPCVKKLQNWCNKQK